VLCKMLATELFDWTKPYRIWGSDGSIIGAPNVSFTFFIRLLNQSAGTIQDAQLSQRDRAAECVIVFAKSRRLKLGDNILRTV